MARLVSSWSKDPSTQAGAVIVDRSKRVISVGFNGFPRGMPDRAELYADRDEKYSRIIHAEINALTFARGPVCDATLYTWPFMCCDRCVVQMLQAGITGFVAPKPHADKLERWGQSFMRARQYINECSARYEEVEL